VSATYSVRHTPSGSSQRPVNRPSVAYCQGVHAHGSGIYPTRQTTRPAASGPGFADALAPPIREGDHPTSAPNARAVRLPIGGGREGIERRDLCVQGRIGRDHGRLERQNLREIDNRARRPGDPISAERHNIFRGKRGSERVQRPPPMAAAGTWPGEVHRPEVRLPQVDPPQAGAEMWLSAVSSGARRIVAAIRATCRSSGAISFRTSAAT